MKIVVLFLLSLLLISCAEPTIKEEKILKSTYDKDGYDREGFNKKGYDSEGYHKSGFNVKGYDREGYDKSGFNVKGYDREGYDKSGFNLKGYDREGYDKSGFNVKGYDREGYNKSGFNDNGYDRKGYDKSGFDDNGYNNKGENKESFVFKRLNKKNFLRKNDKVSDIIKSMNTRVVKGKYEKQKDFEIRKAKANQFDLDKVYASNLHINNSTFSYDADTERMYLSLGERRDKYGSMYRSTTRLNYRIGTSYNRDTYDSVGVNGFGARVNIHHTQTTKEGLIFFDENTIKKLSKYRFYFPLDIKKAKKLDGKIKVKVLYQIAKKIAIEENSLLEATFDSPSEYFTMSQNLLIKPLGIIIYSGEAIIKSVAFSNIIDSKIIKEKEKEEAERLKNMPRTEHLKKKKIQKCIDTTGGWRYSEYGSDIICR